MYALLWILSVLSEMLKMSLRGNRENGFQCANCIPFCVLRNEHKIGVIIDMKG